MDFKYHNIDVVLEITGSDALFHNTSILDILKSLKELSEPAGDANSGRVPKRRREEEEPKTPEKKGHPRRKLSFDDVGSKQSAAHPDHSLEELETSGSKQSPPHPDHPFEDLEASGSKKSAAGGSKKSAAYPHHHSFKDLETSGSKKSASHPHHLFEDLEASSSRQSPHYPHHLFEDLEASGSNQSPPHPDHSFEDLEASGSSQSPNYPHHSLEDLETGSPDTEETLAHSSPLQPLGLIRNTEDLMANYEVSWFLEAKTWKLNEDEIRKLYQNRVEKIHDCIECGVVLQSYKALSDHEKSDDHVQEKKKVEIFFNSKVKAMCPICGIGAGNKTKLRNHVLSHFLWTFACPKCPKLFCSIRGYRNHRHLLMLSQKKKYACECGCWFVEKRTLRLHKTRELHRKRMAFINPQEAESIAEPETVADIMGLIMDESFPDLFQ